jgi:hypothetical protein
MTDEEKKKPTVEELLELVIKRIDDMELKQVDFRSAVNDKMKQFADVLNKHTEWINRVEKQATGATDDAPTRNVEQRPLTPAEEAELMIKAQERQRQMAQMSSPMPMPPMGDPIIQKILEIGERLAFPNKPTNAQVYESTIAPMQTKELVDALIAQQKQRMAFTDKLFDLIEKKGIEAVVAPLSKEIVKGSSLGGVLTE